MSQRDLKRILFVDDDQALLAGLRTRLRAQEGKWDMAFAESGAKALQEFEHKPFDVIVSDARMPSMDGAQLLRAVSERWPDTVRIVLSGFADRELGTQFVGLAHQYLRKPCHAPQFDNVIERCLQVRELLHSPALRSVVGRVRQLPVMPRIYTKLQAAMANENVTMREIAQIVTADAAVTARVLQMANSAFYRRPRRIANIEQAVTQLGFASLRNLVLCAEVFARWPQQPASAPLDLGRLQLHVQAVAAVAYALTAKTALTDDAVLAALLHEIGYWVLLQECPAELTRALDLALTERISMHEAERRTIGASHAHIGAYLLGIWGLPFPVVEAVAYHHAPWQVKQTEFDVLAALAAARALSGTDDADAFRGSPPREGGIDAEYFNALAPPFDWTEAERRGRQSLQPETGLFS